jgi:AcrR family transcriptional regulator
VRPGSLQGVTTPQTARPAAKAETAGRAPLTYDRIVDAAIRLVDAHGLGALSMRRLGAELGVEAMSLYHYVPGKRAILEGMAIRVVRDAPWPALGEGRDWREQVRLMARALRSVAHAHPHVFALVVDIPVTDEAVLSRSEMAFETLRRAGFDKETAFRAYDTIVGYVVGFALNEIGGQTVSGLDPTQHDHAHAVAAALRALPPERYPRLREMARLRLPEANSDAQFEFGLDLLVDGLAARL